MRRVVLIAILWATVTTNAWAEDPVIAAPAEPTWDIELVNCPIFSVTRLFAFQGVTCREGADGWGVRKGRIDRSLLVERV